MKNCKLVSEWILRGALKTNWMPYTCPVKETERAYAFKTDKFNSYGNLKENIMWIPKSKIIVMENDYYTDGIDKYYFVHLDFLNKKRNEGYDV